MFVLTHRHSLTSGSAKSSLRSCGSLHNETVNIYTHFLGAVVFALLPLWFYRSICSPDPQCRPADLAVFSLYLGGVAVCFTLSTLYVLLAALPLRSSNSYIFQIRFHVFSNHSAGYASLLNHLDYLGIIVLMWGAGVPTIYYGFHEDAALQNTYWGLVIATTVLTASSSHRADLPFLYTDVGNRTVM